MGGIFPAYGGIRQNRGGCPPRSGKAGEWLCLADRRTSAPVRVWRCELGVRRASAFAVIPPQAAAPREQCRLLAASTGRGNNRVNERRRAARLERRRRERLAEGEHNEAGETPASSKGMPTACLAYPQRSSPTSPAALRRRNHHETVLGEDSLFPFTIAFGSTVGQARL